MPPKTTPKPANSAELMDLSAKLIAHAQRMLVNKQISVDVYKSLIATSNTITDVMLSLEEKPASK